MVQEVQNLTHLSEVSWKPRNFRISDIGPFVKCPCIFQSFNLYRGASAPPSKGYFLGKIDHCLYLVLESTIIDHKSEKYNDIICYALAWMREIFSMGKAWKGILLQIFGLKKYLFRGAPDPPLKTARFAYLKRIAI